MQTSESHKAPSLVSRTDGIGHPSEEQHRCAWLVLTCVLERYRAAKLLLRASCPILVAFQAMHDSAVDSMLTVRLLQQTRTFSSIFLQMKKSFLTIPPNSHLMVVISTFSKQWKSTYETTNCVCYLFLTDVKTIRNNWQTTTTIYVWQATPNNEWRALPSSTEKWLSNFTISWV